MPYEHLETFHGSRKRRPTEQSSTEVNLSYRLIEKKLPRHLGCDRKENIFLLLFTVTNLLCGALL